LTITLGCRFVWFVVFIDLFYLQPHLIPSKAEVTIEMDSDLGLVGELSKDKITSVKRIEVLVFE
jgi:hypothetical protein